MNAGATRVSPRWLALREPADAKARARDLVERLQRALPASGRRMIHDLGCGTGAMGRWLAPLLAGQQHWVLHDRDADLLALAVADDRPAPAADGAAVTVEARRTDLASVHARDLAGATLITASALLDLLTEPELDRLAGVCAAAECPILLTLSVTGRVEIAPAAPLDLSVTAAFNAHQRRATERGRLLGPDAVGFAVEAFRRLGAEVLLRPSPWRLGPAHPAHPAHSAHSAHSALPAHPDLAAEWLTGWVGAACEQEIGLRARCEPYARERLEQASAGQLAVSVGHADLLVLP